MKDALTWFNIVLRGCLEAAIIAAFAYWGAFIGSTFGAKIGLAIATPVVLFGIWSMVDFRSAGRFGEPLRLIEELVISGLAVLALLICGQTTLAAALAALSAIHHALGYVLGQRLIARRA